MLICIDKFSQSSKLHNYLCIALSDVRSLLLDYMKLKKFNLPFGAQIFKSFSDEARIRIMFLLSNEKELCISDIEHILDFTQTKTSRHVAYLKNAGLLSQRKKDQWVFYQIKEEVLGMVEQIFKFLTLSSSC